MKIANIIGKIIMVVFGVSSIRWVAAMFGVLGMRFYAEDLTTVGLNIVLFIVGIIVVACTRKKGKK